MNTRAEKVFLMLPKAIDQIDIGIIYSHDGSMNEDHDFIMFRIDLTYLLIFYQEKRFFNQKQIKSLTEQLNSKCREDWLLAFIIIDSQRERLWKENLSYEMSIFT